MTTSLRSTVSTGACVGNNANGTTQVAQPRKRRRGKGGGGWRGGAGTGIDETREDAIMSPPRGETRGGTAPMRSRRARVLTSLLLMAGGGVSSVSSATGASAAAAGGAMMELVDAAGKLASASEITSLLR